MRLLRLIHFFDTILMAWNAAKEPLLSGSVDPTSQIKNACANNRRRFRRVRSAPLAEFVPSDIKGDGSFPQFEFISGRVHQSLKQVAIFLAVYLSIGTISFYIIRDDLKGKRTTGMLDAMYFCIVTMTTVGYGDLVPNSVLAKLLACLFVFTGMALVGLVLSKAADYLVEKQEILLVKAIHMRQKLGPSETLKEVETKRVKYKCFLAMGILSLLMVVGIIFLIAIEDLDPIDAIYCVCSTITTLGYGDKSFSTAFGRTFAIFWILTGTVGLGQLFLYVTELFTEARQRALVNWVLTRKMTKVDLEAADLDSDGVVGAAEFIIYKLKEMGKISEEDILPVLEEFEYLDFDQSGTLSASDLVLAQTPQSKR